jgi:squalene-hopene/tetraprenyl-beta-curcumene cyclase
MAGWFLIAEASWERLASVASQGSFAMGRKSPSTARRRRNSRQSNTTGSKKAFDAIMIDPKRVQNAYEQVRRELLAARDASGHWVGELSTSALATATAASALHLYLRYAIGIDDRRGPLQELARNGLAWLARHQNADGGWGDTDKSVSNISTTMLVFAAFHLGGKNVVRPHAKLLAHAERYLNAQGGASGIRRRYGVDKTFAVPILANAALAGLVPWNEVAPLPFEMACLPHAVLGLLRLPVVSYAIPALVAIGQARFVHAPPRNPIVRAIRRRAVAPSLAILERMQPASGGFLEATPLTSFVAMSLASIGQANHPVVERGIEFLVASVRPDGSWPIDTNLAAWTTTLSVNALAAGPEGLPPEVASPALVEWLLACQHRRRHPFTNAAPGGWGWTDLSGAVPDADDTPGALLALASLRDRVTPAYCDAIDRAARLGAEWLVGLQNSDGGWPTFCRGWGKLPFDRSGVDLTAHVLRALHAWRQLGADGETPVELPAPLAARCDRSVVRGLAFLAKHQAHDGSWRPLWFGNQHWPDDENPIYGTSRVLLAYRDLGQMAHPAAQRGIAWLASQAGPDGGYGAAPRDSCGNRAGVSSMEETAVAVEALLAAESSDRLQPVVEQGLAWMIEAIEAHRHDEPSPIGLYFARLWYYEKLYPLSFTAAALGRAMRRVKP